jgi:hypothetical protein
MRFMKRWPTLAVLTDGTLMLTLNSVAQAQDKSYVMKNRRGVRTASGKRLHATQIIRLRDRLGV